MKQAAGTDKFLQARGANYAIANSQFCNVDIG